MDIISYKGGRALFIDSEDIMRMNNRLTGGITPREAAIRMIIENRKKFGICAVVIVTSMGFMNLPKFLRETLAEDVVSASGANCFRNEW